MKIKYKDYTIENDKYCIIVSEFGYKKNKKNPEESKYGVIHQTFHPDLYCAIKKVFKREQYKKVGEIELMDLENILKTVNSETISELEKLKIITDNLENNE